MSEISDMLNNPNHPRLTQKTWNDMLFYIRREDTIYRLMHYYSGKSWLENQSPKFKDSDWRCYIPVGTKKGETYIGYIWEKANMSNWLLSNGSIHRTVYYPNLIWCDLGNHPYPKEVRTTETWIQENFNKMAHKLVHPDTDIAKAVIFFCDLPDS